MILGICDDEAIWRQRLMSMISCWAHDMEGNVSFVEMTSSEEAKVYLKAHSHLDALFLDISFDRVSPLDGITLSRQFRKDGFTLPIIFVTSHTLLASEGYLVDAFGFISKPFEQERINMYMTKLTNYIATQKSNSYLARTPDRVYQLPLESIIYVEAFAHDIVLYTDEEELRLRQSMNGILNELGEERFIRIHRAFIVAADRIKHVKITSPYELSIKRGGHIITLSVGRTYVDAVQKIYANTIVRGLL